MSAERSLSTKIERPALAAALARLTGKPPERFTNVKDVHELGVSTRPSYKCIPWAKMAPVFEARRVGKRLVRVQVQAARTMGAGEALTELYEAGLWPWAPGDVDAPRWSCERCDGGRTARSAMARGVGRICGDCFNEASVDAPSSFAALVAVASLGRDVLERLAQRGDGYVSEVARADGFAVARCVFRVMARSDLAEVLDRNCRWMSDGDDGPASIYAFDASFFSDRGELDFRAVGDRCPVTTDRAEAAWPATRDMSRCGAHLIALTDGYVTLAVEAV